MNKPTRQLASLVIIMFLSLLAAATWIQFIKASDLSADDRNVRTIFREYGKERGKIIVDGQVIASSVPTENGRYKFQRVYESPELYAHITGYFSTSLNSMTGLERAENSVLGGSDSDLATQRLQELIGGEQPRGGSVELTIDPAMQKTAYDALDGQKGAIVALNPKTGEILALVSYPSFDTNKLASPDGNISAAYAHELEEDSNKPLDNRAIGGDQSSPGSTFKVVTAAAALENDPSLTADTLVEAPATWKPPDSDKKIANYGGHSCGTTTGKVALRTAMTLSCNPPFAILAVDMGADKFIEQTESFGFGKPLNIPLEVTPSRVPMPTSQAGLAMDAFGQNDVMVTPLQMAMVAAAVANDGTLMTPYLVKRTYTADLELISETEPTIYSQPMRTSTAAEIQKMMVDVVRIGGGTSAAIPGIQVAAKTGTAEVPGKAPQSWFIGYAPADDPQIAVAIFVENSGRAGDDGLGATVAAPMAKQIFTVGLSK